MALDQLDAQSVLGLPPGRAAGAVQPGRRAGGSRRPRGLDAWPAWAVTAMSWWHWRPPWLCALPVWAMCWPTWPRSRETATADAEDEADLSGLPWPAVEAWVEHVASSPAVSVGDDGPDDRPLRLVGTGLYLDRYWRDEVSVASDLIARSSAEPFGAEEALLADGLGRLFPDGTGGLQRRAAEIAVRRHFSVIAGGPGTGKTTTVARLLALLDEQAAVSGGPPLLVALAAPTGKAAARMAEAVHAEGRKLDVDEAVRARLLTLGASTVHRLLGRHPASANRFRHNRDNRLPHDVVIVDETSMMSLPLMARLLEAVRRRCPPRPAGGPGTIGIGGGRRGPG